MSYLIVGYITFSFLNDTNGYENPLFQPVVLWTMSQNYIDNPAKKISLYNKRQFNFKSKYKWTTAISNNKKLFAQIQAVSVTDDQDA